MIKIDNEFGTISISLEYLTELVAHTVQNAYGVAGMAYADVAQSIRAAVDKSGDHMSRGVRVRTVNGGLSLDLHIVVTYGANIAAISKSLVHEVKYAVENATGLTVAQVNVFVDNIVHESER